MELPELLGLLSNVRSVGKNSYRALCPAHGDRRPSLVITLKRGRILLFCNGGCSAREVTAALGVSLGDLFPRSQETLFSTNSFSSVDEEWFKFYMGSFYKAKGGIRGETESPVKTPSGDIKKKGRRPG